VERLAGQQVLAHREHLDQLHESSAQVLGAFENSFGVADVGFEQLAILGAARKKRPANGGPQVAGADLRGESAHLESAPGASLCDGIARRHHAPPSRSIPTRLINVAASAAPKPLSILTTVTPLAQVFSIPSSADIPPKAAP